MTAIKILVATTDPTSVTNYYRTTGPLSAKPDAYQFQTTPAVPTWLDLSNTDILCVPSPKTPHELACIEAGKSAGVPVWIDYSENWLEIPESHPDYLAAMQVGLRENVLTAVDEADLVTVATTELSRLFQQARMRDGANPVVVVKSGLGRWPARAQLLTRSDGFAWSGSSARLQDALAFAPSLARGLPEDAGFTVLGWFPWPLTNAAFTKTTELRFIKELPPMRYFKELANCNSTCALITLDDTLFNRCKSNVAQLEALAAGMLPIVPAWEEWQLGVEPYPYKYQSPEQFLDLLDNHMEVPYEERQGWWRHQLGMAEAQSADASAKRLDLLHNLVGP
jgi:hypothetical protein